MQLFKPAGGGGGMRRPGRRPLATGRGACHTFPFPPAHPGSRSLSRTFTLPLRASSSPRACLRKRIYQLGKAGRIGQKC